MIKIWLSDVVKIIHGILYRSFLPLIVQPPRKLHQGKTLTIVRVALMGFLEGWQDRIYGKVLDVGSGSWPFPRQLSKGHCDYNATDWVDQEGIDIVSDIHQLTNVFAPEYFDFVICTEVVEHVRYPWLAIKEVISIMKPGGILLLSVPLNFHLHTENDYWRITNQGLTILLKGEAGFDKVEISHVGHPKFPFSYHVVAYK